MGVLCLGTHSGFARQSHRECRIRCRSEFGTRPCLERATERRSQSAIERVTERAIRGRARPGADSGAEAPSLYGVDCGADGVIGRRVEPSAHCGTDERAKSLIDGHIEGHIDGRGMCGIECPSHPGIDPPGAGASAGQDRCPCFAPAFRPTSRGRLSPAP